MCMYFIKILGNVINEQIKKSQPTRSSSQPSSKGGWSKVPSHRWESGDKIAPPLSNPGKCNNYGQIRDKGTPKERTHNACDISTNPGTSIFAPYDGNISKYNSSDCGNGIELKGEDENGKKMVSTFCHLTGRQIPLNGKVTKGQLIGFTGGARGHAGSGNSLGAHLHWTFKVDGVSTNPYTYN